MGEFQARKPSSPLVLFLLLASSFMVFAVVAAPPAAHAQSVISITTSDGSTVCNGTNTGSLIDGSWSGSTCTVSPNLTIPSGTTLDVGAGVTVTASFGFSNSGTINNAGTVSAGGNGISNSGTINSYGTVSGTGVAGVAGISNSGTINNNGTMSGRSDSAVAISNSGTINDYCGVTLSDTSYGGPSPNAISCYTVTFDQSGIPSGVTWGVTASWGPFVLPEDHTGTGASITVQLTGSLTYAYDTPVTSSDVSYDCTGCSGTTSVNGDTTITATYSQVISLGFITSDFSTLQSDLKGNFTSLSGTLGGLQTAVSGLSTTLTDVSTSVTSGFSTVETDLSSIENTLSGISSQITGLQSSVSKLGQPTQEVTGDGESTLTPASSTATIFTSPSGQLGTVTVGLSTTGVGHKDSVTIRYYTSPSNPALFIQKTLTSNGDTPGFTDSAPAWKVVLVASFGSKTGSITVDWAYSALEPPS